MDAKRHALAFRDQRPQRHHDALGGGVERGDLRDRVLVQRVEPQALGGAGLEQAGEGGRALLVVMQDADHERPPFGLAREPGRRLEDCRRRVVGVVEHQERGPATLTGLGDGRQRGLGDLPAARVQHRRSGGLEPRRASSATSRVLPIPRGTPDERADDLSRARVLPAPAQPAQLALASGEQGRAALELDGQLHDRRRRVEARVLGQHRRLEALQLRPGLDPDLLDQRLARAAVGVQRVGLPPGAIEGEHALSVEALAQRLLRDQFLETGDHLVVASGGELGVDRELDRPQVKLLEPADLGAANGSAATSASGAPRQSSSAARAAPFAPPALAGSRAASSTRRSNRVASTASSASRSS